MIYQKITLHGLEDDHVALLVPDWSQLDGTKSETVFNSGCRGPKSKLDSGSLPVAIRASEERLSKGGVYLLETGLHLFLWVGASVQQELLQSLFGTNSFSQIDPSATSLPELDNPLSVRLRELISEFRAQRPRYMKLMVVKQEDRSELIFRHFLVEDKSASGGASYVDFLCHMHKEIRQLLS